jgi:serine/threonine protein kinase
MSTASLGSLSGSETSFHGGVPKRYAYMRDKSFDDWEVPPWEVDVNLDQCLGKGEFGTAYIATWRGTNVVAKVAHQSPVAAALLQREFSTMARIHHPNCVQFLGWTVDPCMIVMEHMSGGNLRQLLDRVWFLWPWRRVEIAKDILRGVAYFHGRRPVSVIHRDLKPENILLTASGKAKISDFGVSRMAFGEGLDNEKNTGGVGTRKYMAPEVSSGVYDEKVDIWSCGTIFLELLWRRHSVVDKMLSREPKTRPEALEVLRELRSSGWIGEFLVKL